LKLYRFIGLLTFLPFTVYLAYTDRHEFFCRDDPKACERIERIKTGKRAKLAANQMMTINVTQASGCVSPGIHMQNPLEELEPIDFLDDQHQQEDIDGEIISLFPPNAKYTICSTESLPPSFGQKNNRLFATCHSLKALLSYYVSSMKVDLEPRRIEDMISEPDRLYRSTPSMSPEQQATFDMLLPISLPILFYYLDMSALAHGFGILLICIHTIESISTDFGGGAWYKSVMGPLQHVVGDMILNHLFNSTFLFLGPSLLGKKCYPLILIVIILNVTVTAVNYKVHFEAFILKGMSCGKDTIPDNVLQYKMGRHIQRMFQSYGCAWILLTFSFVYLGDRMIQAIALFVYNLLPFVSDFSYWLEFSKQLSRLPTKDRNLLFDRHMLFFVPGDNHGRDIWKSQ
jgi:hypothetical protein